MLKILKGSIVARVIGFAALPILTRLYAPEDFGVLAIFTALVLLIKPFLSLRYAMAIPLPQRDDMAMNVLVLSLLVALGAAAILLTALAIFPGRTLDILHSDAIRPYAWLLLFSLPLVGLGECMSGWATRKRSYGLMAKREVFAKATSEATKLALGLLALKPLGLLIGQVLFQAGGALGFLRRFWGEFVALWPHVTPRRIWFAARYYRGFPLYRLPSQALLAYAMQAPLLFTAGTYGTAISGQLGLALTTLAMPLNLMGNSMGRAFYAEAANLGRKRPREIADAMLRVQLQLFIVGMGPTVALMFFGPDLFTLVFGSQWLMAGQFASSLAVYLLLQFVSAPVMQVLNVLNRQGAFLAINILRAVMIAGLFWAVAHLDIPVADFVRIYGWLMGAFYCAITVFVLILAGVGQKSRAGLGE